MERDATSILEDIKKYEDTLAREPGSCCFAPLAELYRKQGLLDEAITVAKRGCEIHPDYVGGYMALGRAYLEKGMKDESRAALEKVVGITPENLLAQKLLSQIYLELGDPAAAERALRVILSQTPGDIESQTLLDSLTGRFPANADPEPGTAGGHEWEEEGFFPEFGIEVADSLMEGAVNLEDDELIEELTDEDLLEEDEFVVSPAKADSPLEEDEVFSEGQNPINTVTMAELYVSQGFVKRALTIYRELLETDPDNAGLKKRLYELKKAIDDDAASARHSVLTSDEAMAEAAGASVGVGGHLAEMEMAASAVTEERVIETLEKWLATIGRRR